MESEVGVVAPMGPSPPHPEGTTRGYVHGSRPLGVTPYNIRHVAGDVEVYCGSLHVLSKDTGRGSLISRKATGFKERFCVADPTSLSVWASQDAWEGKEYAKQKYVLHYRDLKVFVPVFTSNPNGPGEFHPQAVRQHGGLLWSFFGFYTEGATFVFCTPNHVDYEGWSQFMSRNLLHKGDYLKAFPRAQRSVRIQVDMDGAGTGTGGVGGGSSSGGVWWSPAGVPHDPPSPSISSKTLAPESPAQPADAAAAAAAAAAAVADAEVDAATAAAAAAAQTAEAAEAAEAKNRLELGMREYEGFLALLERHMAARGRPALDALLFPTATAGTSTTSPTLVGSVRTPPALLRNETPPAAAQPPPSLEAESYRRRVAELEAALAHKQEVIRRLQEGAGEEGGALPALRWTGPGGGEAESASAVVAARQTVELQRLRREAAEGRGTGAAALAAELLRAQERARRGEERVAELEELVDADQADAVRRLRAALARERAGAQTRERLAAQRLTLAARSRDAAVASLREELAHLRETVTESAADVSARVLQAVDGGRRETQRRRLRRPVHTDDGHSEDEGCYDDGDTGDDDTDSFSIEHIVRTACRSPPPPTAVVADPADASPGGMDRVLSLGLFAGGRGGDGGRSVGGSSSSPERGGGGGEPRRRRRRHPRQQFHTSLWSDGALLAQVSSFDNPMPVPDPDGRGREVYPAVNRTWKFEDVDGANSVVLSLLVTPLGAAAAEVRAAVSSPSIVRRGGGGGGGGGGGRRRAVLTTRRRLSEVGDDEEEALLPTPSPLRRPRAMSERRGMEQRGGSLGLDSFPTVSPRRPTAVSKAPHRQRVPLSSMSRSVSANCW